MEKKTKNNGIKDTTRTSEADAGMETENLGLDADHSSENSVFGYLNNDNDRISHNPDGESDDSDDDEGYGHSPLMDK